MAEYHLSVKTVSRSSGRSAPAAAAYRAGTIIVNETDGTVHDYSRRRGVDREYGTFIVAPEGVTWAQDRAALWNAAEKAETRKNSTVAREYELGLPHELDQDDRIILCRKFAEWVVAQYGVAVDVAVHQPSRGGDNRNWHAHVLTTTRTCGRTGFGPKTRILDDRSTGPAEVERIRAAWAAMSNAALECAGIDDRISHLSHRARNLDKAPGRHHGPTATGIERREKARAARQGKPAEPVSERIREVALRRAEEQAGLDAARRLKDEISALEDELVEAEAAPWLNERLQQFAAEEDEKLDRLAAAKARRLVDELQRKRNADGARQKAEQRRRDQAQAELRRQEARAKVAEGAIADEEACLAAKRAAAEATELARAAGTRGVRSDGLMERPPAIWDGALRWRLRDGERWYLSVGERLFTERHNQIVAHEISNSAIDVLLKLSEAKWPEGFVITGDAEFVARAIERAALRSTPVLLFDPAQRAAYQAAHERLWKDDDDEDEDQDDHTSNVH